MGVKVVLILAAVSFCSLLWAQDATEVVRRVDERMRGESSRAEMTMRIIRPDWTRELSVRAYSLSQDFSMIYILSPPRDRGTSFLKRYNEVWQWVPSIQRVVRIPPSMMTQSWMGSDFTNDDLVQEASIVDDYEHSFLPDTTVEQMEAWRVEMVPKPEAAVVWDRVEMWVTKDDYNQRRALYYDEDGVLVNDLTLDSVRELGGREIPTRWEMVPVDEQGQSTVMEYDDLEFDIDIDEGFFSQQNMRTIR
ncbi:outer membrane lipoprotein-sorting protein [Chitinispirillales bacterium ANBcel5]|uniref:outer membrane lipoprotein-sorting protein n=1 Tax=Cellulosispirillum alkaliphilum TaxID=3039283 RepID=UPI002A4FFC05|nr:outer membrane lipoprotein-sorting protein [Chitinispirillales bacterium ANBcel5]